jgi:hypothetical protein
MSDIKTITETIASGSYAAEEKFLKNDEIEEVLTIKLLKEKIDELVVEVNKLKG